MSIVDRFKLDGKVAIITGGAGLYGRQLVECLAEAGAKVYTASRNLEALEKLAVKHRGNGLDVEALRLDQTDECSIIELRDEVMGRSGHIEILVNNAVARPMKKGFHDDASTFAESMQANATGIFMMTRAIGDVMADGGSIINIGSIQGMVGPDPTLYVGTEMSGWYPDYFFHKGGLINLTKFVASYYGSRGIRCNCLSPGGFWTESMPESFVANYSARTFLGRLANDTDMQGVLVFLASDASAYVTGTNIPVDGGYTAK